MTSALYPERLLCRCENLLATACLSLMAFLPLVEIVSRAMGIAGIVGSADYVRHLTLWIGFLGAVLTTRENLHLRLHAGVDYLPAKLKRKNVGVWVLLFLALFAMLAYLLKAEYWRDVH